MDPLDMSKYQHMRDKNFNRWKELVQKQRLGIDTITSTKSF